MAQISWTELIVLMAFGAKDGNTAGETVRGTIHTRETWKLPDDADVEHGESVIEHPALGRLAVREGTRRALRRGSAVRMERLDGSPTRISNGGTTWLFGTDPPTRYDGGAFGFSGQDLIYRRPPSRWEGSDFTSLTGPIESVEFLGRPAYEFELAPPSHKPYPLQMVVDAASGLILREGNRDFGSVAEWVELEIDIDLPESLFTWDGPTQSPDQAHADRHAEHEREMARRRTWLAERGLLGLPLPASTEFLLHEHSGDGSFYASLHVRVHATLLRRPLSDSRSDSQWEAAETVNYPHVYRWRDSRWEWLLGVGDRPLSDQDLAALKSYLAETT